MNFFLNILKDGETNDIYKVLLNGGTYKDSSENLHTFVGLKTTLSYFVYAQNVMTGDFQSTRYGMRLKDGDYSSAISSKERSDCYNNAPRSSQSLFKRVPCVLQKPRDC